MTCSAAKELEWRFAANGLKLVIRAVDEELARIFLPHLSVFSASELTEVDYTIRLVRGEPEMPPADAELIYDGDLVPGVRARLLTRGDLRWLLIPDRLTIRFTPSSAHYTVAETCERFHVALTAMNAMEAALAAAGQFLLHGAALQIPSRSAAMLIFAPSGRGKTTTSLALALGGFSLMTDDAIALAPGNGPGQQTVAWGLPRALKVHRKTVELLPELAPLASGTYDRNGEQAVKTALLAGIAPLAPHTPYPVAAVVVLRERTEGAHIFRPLAKTSALTDIAEDNIRRATGGVAADHMARFRAIADLIQQTPTYELRVGDGLKDVATAIRDVI